MDETHIGPNANTIPEQRAVRVGLYLSGTTLVLLVLHLPRSGFKSCCGQCVGTPTWVGAHKAKYFFPLFLAVGCFDFVPFPGDPGNRGCVAILGLFEG